MNKILLVGNGAREHVMAEQLVANEETELFSFISKVNPGVRKISTRFALGSLTDKEKIVNFAKRHQVDFAIIGPENPLQEGLVDELEKNAIPCASPTRQMSKLEWSKSFTRQLLEKSNIQACPEFKVFSAQKDSIEDLIIEINSFLKDLNNEVAIKPDYLTGGKGVKVWGDHFNSRDEILTYVINVLKNGNKKVIIEQKLIKPPNLVNSEFTLQAFVSNRQVAFMPLVQDYKRAYDGDKGPNTGSMGSYSLKGHKLPFITDNDYDFAKKVMKKTIESVKNYKGILYGQFMLTTDGVKLIEYNCRFGDPEAMNVLPLLKNDFSQCCQEIIDNSLKQKEWLPKATVCVYLTPNGYPVSPQSNKKISINEEGIKKANNRIYYASVDETTDGSIITTKSRSIGLLGLGDSVEEARMNVYNSITSIKGDLHYRLDIAKGIG